MKNKSLKRAAALLLGVTLAAQSVSAVLPVTASEDVFAAESAETELAIPEPVMTIDSEVTTDDVELITNPFENLTIQDGTVTEDGKTWPETYGVSISYWVKAGVNDRTEEQEADNIIKNDSILFTFQNDSDDYVYEVNDLMKYEACVAYTECVTNNKGTYTGEYSGTEYTASDFDLGTTKTVTLYDTKGGTGTATDYTVIENCGKLVRANPSYNPNKEKIYCISKYSGDVEGYESGSTSKTRLIEIGECIWEEYHTLDPAEGSKVKFGQISGSLTIAASNSFAFKEDDYTVESKDDGNGGVISTVIQSAVQLNPNSTDYSVDENGNPNYPLQLRHYNDLYFQGDGTVCAENENNETSWHYVTCVIQNDAVVFYVDGEQYTAEDGLWMYSPSNGIGFTNTDAGKYFNDGYGYRYPFYRGTPKTWSTNGTMDESPCNSSARTIMEWLSDEDTVLMIGGQGSANIGLESQEIGNSKGTLLDGIAFYNVALTEEQAVALYEAASETNPAETETPEPDETPNPAETETPEPDETPTPEPSEENDDLQYVVKEDGTVEITGCAWDATELVIPAEIDGYPVTSIGDWAFCWCSGLTNVTIPEGVTSIGDGAFEGCSSLTSMTIPSSVTSIGDSAFEYCSNLAEIDVDSENTTYSSVDGVLFDKDRTELICYPGGKSGDYAIPSSVTSIGEYAFCWCSGLTNVTIPEGVTSIGDGAFEGCSSLTSVTIPSSVTSIGDWAFSDCESLTGVTIPEGVTSIGDYAFSDCYSLTSVTIPSSVTSIGEGTFYGCYDLTTVTIPSGVTSIGDSAFKYCSNLTEIDVDSENTTYSSVDGVLFDKDRTELICCPEGKSGDYTIPDGVTSIGDYAFDNCYSLTSVTIPSSVTSIGDGAFRWCDSLTSVTIPEGVTSIGDYAFRWCDSLTSMTIPSSVTSIGDDAFWGCDSLTNVTISEGVTSIGDDAFWGCDSLTSVTIPSSVTSIGDSAFLGCSSLTEINVDPANTTYSSVEGVVFSKDRTELICCPGGKSEDYTIPSSVTSIGNSAFSGCDGLTGVTIPEGVTSIGNRAFSDCYSLTSVTIPSSVTSIGYGAFYWCESLTSVTIPEGVTSIGEYVFGWCSGLTSVTIPSSVTNIGWEAFVHCSSLTSVTIPDGVTSIGDWAFSDCYSLTSVTIPSSVTSIGEYVFGWCSSLTSVTIPSGVTSIGEGTFSGCSSLTSVAIPSSVTNIGWYAFSDCTSLTDVFYTGSETEWNEIFIEDYNESLFNAAIHCDSPMPTDAPTDTPAPTETVAPTETPTPAPNETAKPNETETPNLGETGTPAPAPETDFTAKETDSGVSVEKYIGTDATVVVPDQIAGKPVTEIGANAFADTAVKEIVLPESVTGIGKGAFANCENLESIVILGDEIEIAGDAFTGCGNLTIKCLKNSAAQQYAKEHGIACESLYYYGDVNMDGVVAAADALDILKDVVQLAPITGETARQLANIDGAGGITASDALGVLKVVVQLQAKEVYFGK